MRALSHNRWFTIVLFLLIFCQLNGQKRFEAGEIYTLEGDTINGYLKPLTDEEQSQFITFSADLKSRSSKNYTADELAGYRLANGVVYHSRSIEVFALSTEEKRPWQASRISRFLELLRDGPVRLYRYHNASGGVLLLNRSGQSEADALFQIVAFFDRDQPQSNQWDRDTIFERNLLQTDSRQFFLEPAYIGRLQNYLSDCLDEKIAEDLPFNITAILSLLNRYSVCKTGQKTVKPKITNQWSLVGLVGFSQYLRDNVRPSFIPNFGIEFGNLSFSRSFRFSFHYSRIQLEEPVNFFAPFPTELNTLEVSNFGFRGQYFLVNNRRFNPYVYGMVAYQDGQQSVGVPIYMDEVLIGVSYQKSELNEVTAFVGMGTNLALGAHQLRLEIENSRQFGSFTARKGLWSIRVQYGLDFLYR